MLGDNIILNRSQNRRIVFCGKGKFVQREFGHICKVISCLCFVFNC